MERRVVSFDFRPDTVDIQHFKLILNELPLDTQISGTGHGHNRKICKIFFRSKEFPETLEGNEFPIIDFQFRRNPDLSVELTKVIWPEGWDIEVDKVTF